MAALKKMDQYRNPLKRHEEESITKEEEKYVLRTNKSHFKPIFSEAFSIGWDVVV